MTSQPKNQNAFGVWDGEVTVDLPEKFDASVYFIGRIRTPWRERKQCPKNARESDEICTVEVDPLWAPGLKNVETCTHVILLYWMDRAPRNIVLQVPGHYGVQRGTFALRSPVRPNASSQSRNFAGLTKPASSAPSATSMPRPAPPM